MVRRKKRRKFKERLRERVRKLKAAVPAVAAAIVITFLIVSLGPVIHKIYLTVKKIGFKKFEESGGEL